MVVENGSRREKDVEASTYKVASKEGTLIKPYSKKRGEKRIEENKLLDVFERKR